MFSRKNILFIVLVLFAEIAFNQGVKIGNWRAHLPLNQVKFVAEAENKIYAATPYSLFYYDKSDASVNQLNKVNGLSDVGISAIYYNKAYKTLVVAYKNTNIDLITESRIINIPDIKNKSIPGNKKINKITSSGKLIYLSCGFGIVVIDIARKEIKDTYIIGDNGSRIDVFDVAVNDTSLYAATEVGIYKAYTNAPNLADFNNWKKDSSLTNYNAKYSYIAFFNNKIIVCKDHLNTNADTLLVLNGNNWQAFDTNYVFNLSFHNDFILSSNYGYGVAFNKNLEKVFYFIQIDQQNISPNQIIYDKDNNFWIADDNKGLIMYNVNSGKTLFVNPNSPSTKNNFAINYAKQGILVAPGGYDNGVYSNSYIDASYHIFSDETWNNYTRFNIPGLDTIDDIVDIVEDPVNPDKIYAASWFHGLIEFTNHKISKTINETNSSLQALYFGSNRYSMRLGGLAYDEQGNLWITNSGVQKALSVKYRNGSWESFDVNSIVNSDVSKVMIDRNNYVWMLVRGNRIAVFNKKQNQQQKAWININRGSDFATNDINCFAQDLDGEIWIGTDKGIKVIYTPENVFKTIAGEESSVNSQTILVEYGGFNQRLLEFETVTAIAVDGANRKWIGTQKAGIFLISPDGLQQLEHFTTDNSPLLSNTINSICINPQNGEIFIGTDNGIISYRGTATKGETVFSEVYAYPNPVRPDYNGLIAIKGLVRDANVKITDIAGNLVYHTIANGGQAIWNGRNFSGTKVNTGVYLVFCTNEDGEETMVTKIMFVN